MNEKVPLHVFFPKEIKESLAQMSDELNMSQTNLVVLATVSMLANYQKKGPFIFADLINPEHQKSISKELKK